MFLLYVFWLWLNRMRLFEQFHCIFFFKPNLNMRHLNILFVMVLLETCSVAEARKLCQFCHYLCQCFNILHQKYDFYKLPGNIIRSDKLFVILTCESYIIQGKGNLSTSPVDDIFCWFLHERNGDKIKRSRLPMFLSVCDKIKGLNRIIVSI